MNEDQKNWNEMAKTMMKINRKLEEMFNTIHIKDQVRNFKTILK